LPKATDEKDGSGNWLMSNFLDIIKENWYTKIKSS
jgi:hypothetical protein